MPSNAAPACWRTPKRPWPQSTRREDAAWAEIVQEAEQKVQEADELIAQRCQERGVPEDFRPKLSLGWFGRGANAQRERRAELRKLAQAEVAARVKEAKHAIAQEEVRQLATGPNNDPISASARVPG